MTADILVTGATGTVGLELVRQLCAHKVKVRAAVRSPSRAHDLAGLGVEMVPIDYDHPETLAPALRGVRAAFFLGRVGPNFVQASRNFAEAARAERVGHIVKLSAYGADFAPEFHIGRVHRESELAIEAAGVPFTHLRPNIFMQNFVNYHGDALRGDRPIRLAYGPGRVSMVDVRDVAAAAVHALLSQSTAGMAFTLTGPEALSYHDAARILTTVLGRRIEYAPISGPAAAELMRERGAAEEQIALDTNMGEAIQRDTFARVTDDLEHLLGRKPIPFREFVEDIIKKAEEKSK